MRRSAARNRALAEPHLVRERDRPPVVL